MGSPKKLGWMDEGFDGVGEKMFIVGDKAVVDIAIVGTVKLGMVEEVSWCGAGARRVR